MKRFVGLAVAAFVAVAATAAYADSMGSGMSAKPAIFTPSTIKWAAGTGELKGLMVAVLDGNPSKAGPWTIRIKLPAGTKFPVHFHNDTERVTVISGTFLAAIGSTFDESKLMALPAGSFVVIPGGVRHFAETKVATVVQLSGTEAFAMKMDKPGM